MFFSQVKPISISLSPNTEEDDIRLALSLIFQPLSWKKGNSLKILENKIKEYLGVRHAISFNSGRSALMAILSSLDLKTEEEVLVQAFTCNAASNPIKWSGLKPVFVDCDQRTFNMDPEDLKMKITPQSRAVMVQHTFGLPADLDDIMSICQAEKLILIEDCAHALGAEYKGKKVGGFGKASFFSFSRDKIISSVYGGMVCTNDDSLAEKVRAYQENIKFPSYFWILQQLLHPVLMNYLILPTYEYLGKYLLVAFQKLNIMSKAVHWKEKRGKKPDYFPKKMPAVLAKLALNQMTKIERFSEHRSEIANIYYSALSGKNFDLPLKFSDRKNIFLRFTVRHPKAHDIIRGAWDNNLLIGDWYTSPVAPFDTRLESVGYLLGSCPMAEVLSKEIFNLPTHINISEKEAKELAEFIKQHGN